MPERGYGRKEGRGEGGERRRKERGRGDRRRERGKKRGRDRLFLAHGSRGYSAPRRVKGGIWCPASAVRKRRELSAAAPHFLLLLSSCSPLAPRGTSPEWFQIHPTSHVSEETLPQTEPGNCCSLHATLPSDTEVWHLGDSPRRGGLCHSSRLRTSSLADLGDRWICGGKRHYEFVASPNRRVATQIPRVLEQGPAIWSGKLCSV